MKALTPGLRNAFLEAARGRGVAAGEVWDYAKWLRYYLDFCEKFRHEESPPGTGTLRPPPANWLPLNAAQSPPAKGACHPERSEGSRRIRRALSGSPPGGGRSFAALRMTEVGGGGQRRAAADSARDRLTDG